MIISHLLLAAAVAASGVNAQAAYDPVKDFCRRFSHQSAVVGDRLYILGGLLNLWQRGSRNYTNTRFLYHDLSTTKAGAKDLGMPPLKTNLSKPGEMPSLVGGVLWADQANARLFQYGGEWVDGAQPDQMMGWKYDVYGDEWKSYPVDNTIVRTSWGAGTVDESSGIGYWLGGWMDERNNFGWPSQVEKHCSNKLLEYDMVEDTWKNRTAIGTEGTGRAEGALFMVPTGDAGLLVHFGGIESEDGSEALAKPVNMSRIDIIDPANGKVYTHNATGTIPENRRRFCGGIASASDGTSHQIYIYGGMGFGNQTDGFDDLYVLTIPTFQWIRVYPDHVRKSDEKYFPHYDLSCNVVNGGSQMLVIGGEFPKDLEVESCDAPEVAGVHNAFLGKDSDEKTYWAKFDPKKQGYSVPTEVQDVIGGDAQGAAESSNPKNDFDHDLDVLFKRKYTPTPREPTRTAPSGAKSTTSAAPATTTSGLSGTNKLLVIILPCVIGAALILAAILFILRRKRKAAATIPPPAPASTAPETSEYNKHDAPPLSPTATSTTVGPYHSNGRQYSYAGSTTATDHTYGGSIRINSPPPVEIGPGGAPTPAPLSLWPPPVPSAHVAGLEQQANNGYVSPQGQVGGPSSPIHDEYGQGQGGYPQTTQGYASESSVPVVSAYEGGAGAGGYGQPPVQYAAYSPPPPPQQQQQQQSMPVAPLDVQGRRDTLSGSHLVEKQ